MGIFGWSYPPGCSGPPDDYEGPCDVCGNLVDNCVCPECPVCGDYGNPDCYEKHGLIPSLEQIEGRRLRDEIERNEAEADAAMVKAEMEYWEEEARKQKGE